MTDTLSRDIPQSNADIHTGLSSVRVADDVAEQLQASELVEMQFKDPIWRKIIKVVRHVNYPSKLLYR